MYVYSTVNLRNNFTLDYGFEIVQMQSEIHCTTCTIGKRSGRAEGGARGLGASARLRGGVKMSGRRGLAVWAVA